MPRELNGGELQTALISHAKVDHFSCRFEMPSVPRIKQHCAACCLGPITPVGAHSCSFHLLAVFVGHAHEEETISLVKVKL